MKRLFRSTKEKVLGGVCGGIAEYLNMDPTIIRLIWIVLSIWPLHAIGGIIAYLIAWVVIPEKK